MTPSCSRRYVWTAGWLLIVVCAVVVETTDAFTVSLNERHRRVFSLSTVHQKKNHLFSTALTSSTPDESTQTLAAAADKILTSASTNESAITLQKRLRMELIRQEGGRFSFNTKFGALNPFAIYYGVTSILLGLPWFAALTMYQLFQLITFGRFDKLRRIPIFLNQVWGETLLFLTRCYPDMESRGILKKFYET
jgi:hypothetical protein